ATTAAATHAVGGIRDAQIVRHDTLVPLSVVPIRLSPARRGPKVSAFRRRDRRPSRRGRSGSPPRLLPPEPAGPAFRQACPAAGSEAWNHPCLGSTAYENRPPSHRGKTRFGAALVQSRRLPRHA